MKEKVSPLDTDLLKDLSALLEQSSGNPKQQTGNIEAAAARMQAVKLLMPKIFEFEEKRAALISRGAASSSLLQKIRLNERKIADLSAQVERMKSPVKTDFTETRIDFKYEWHNGEQIYMGYHHRHIGYRLTYKLVNGNMGHSDATELTCYVSTAYSGGESGPSSSCSRFLKNAESSLANAIEHVMQEIQSLRTEVSELQIQASQLDENDKKSLAEIDRQLQEKRAMLDRLLQ